MGFKITFNEENAVSTDFEIKDGKYEATIISAELQEYNGEPNFSIGVEIRSDVQQAHQGVKVLYNTVYLIGSGQWAESTERKRDVFLKACGYRGKQELDLEKVEKEILNKNVLVTIKSKPNKEGKVYPKVTWFDETKFPTASNASSASNISVGEDDLPF